MIKKQALVWGIAIILTAIGSFHLYGMMKTPEGTQEAQEINRIVKSINDAPTSVAKIKALPLYKRYEELITHPHLAGKPLGNTVIPKLKTKVKDTFTAASPADFTSSDASVQANVTEYTVKAADADIKAAAGAIAASTDAEKIDRMLAQVTPLVKPIEDAIVAAAAFKASDYDPRLLALKAGKDVAFKLPFADSLEKLAGANNYPDKLAQIKADIAAIKGNQPVNLKDPLTTPGGVKPTVNGGALAEVKDGPSATAFYTAVKALSDDILPKLNLDTIKQAFADVSRAPGKTFTFADGSKKVAGVGATRVETRMHKYSLRNKILAALGITTYNDADANFANRFTATKPDGVAATLLAIKAIVDPARTAWIDVDGVNGTHVKDGCFTSLSAAQKNDVNYKSFVNDPAGSNVDYPRFTSIGSTEYTSFKNLWDEFNAIFTLAHGAVRGAAKSLPTATKAANPNDRMKKDLSARLAAAEALAAKLGVDHTTANSMKKLLHDVTNLKAPTLAKIAIAGTDYFFTDNKTNGGNKSWKAFATAADDLAKTLKTPDQLVAEAKAFLSAFLGKNAALTADEPSVQLTISGANKSLFQALSEFKTDIAKRAKHTDLDTDATHSANYKLIKKVLDPKEFKSVDGTELGSFFDTANDFASLPKATLSMATGTGGAESDDNKKKFFEAAQQFVAELKKLQQDLGIAAAANAADRGTAFEAQATAMKAVAGFLPNKMLAMGKDILGFFVGQKKALTKAINAGKDGRNLNFKDKTGGGKKYENQTWFEALTWLKKRLDARGIVANDAGTDAEKMLYSINELFDPAQSTGTVSGTTESLADFNITANFPATVTNAAINPKAASDDDKHLFYEAAKAFRTKLNAICNKFSDPITDTTGNKFEDNSRALLDAPTLMTQTKVAPGITAPGFDPATVATFLDAMTIQDVWRIATGAYRMIRDVAFRVHPSQLRDATGANLGVIPAAYTDAVGLLNAYHTFDALTAVNLDNALYGKVKTAWNTGANLADKQTALGTILTDAKTLAGRLVTFMRDGRIQALAALSTANGAFAFHSTDAAINTAIEAVVGTVNDNNAANTIYGKLKAATETYDQLHDLASKIHPTHGVPHDQADLCAALNSYRTEMMEFIADPLHWNARNKLATVADANHSRDNIIEPTKVRLATWATTGSKLADLTKQGTPSAKLTADQLKLQELLGAPGGTIYGLWFWANDIAEQLPPKAIVGTPKPTDAVYNTYAAAIDNARALLNNALAGQASIQNKVAVIKTKAEADALLTSLNDAVVALEGALFQVLTHQVAPIEKTIAFLTPVVSGIKFTATLDNASTKEFTLFSAAQLGAKKTETIATLKATLPSSTLQILFTGLGGATILPKNVSTKRAQFIIDAQAALELNRANIKAAGFTDSNVNDLKAAIGEKYRK